MLKWSRIFFLMIPVLCFSQDNLKTYYLDSITVDEHNIPVHYSQDYAPEAFEIRNGFYLKLLKESLLFNKPVEGKHYRFGYMRSFHNPIVIAFSKTKDTYELYWKELLQDSLRSDIRNKGINIKSMSPDKFYKRTWDYIRMRKKQVGKDVWLNFLNLINEVDFFDLPPKVDFMGLDGASNYLEYASPNGYYIIERWSPRGQEGILRIRDFLINLTDIKISKEEKY